MRLIDADALIKEIKMDIEDVGLQERMVFYRINEAPQAEPSDGDLVSRQDAIEAVENNSYGMGSRASVKAIKALPSADAVPHGRLIDADTLIFKLEEWKKNPNNDDSSVDLVNHFIGIIKAEPSADAELVRCRDCRHSEDDITHLYCVYFGHKTYEDDYCSNSVERR